MGSSPFVPPPPVRCSPPVTEHVNHYVKIWHVRWGEGGGGAENMLPLRSKI